MVNKQSWYRCKANVSGELQNFKVLAVNKSQATKKAYLELQRIYKRDRVYPNDLQIYKIAE